MPQKNLNKMIRTILKSFLAILMLTAFVTIAKGQEVDMSRYITFNVVSQTRIELKADNENTPIKIVKENGGSEETAVGTYWTNIAFNEPNETVTIYGDISGFKTYMVPHSGIEYLFVNSCIGLKELYCTSSNLNNLEVSNLTNLQQLDCSYNSLTTLNVSNLTNLEILKCYSNTINNIDISNLTALKRLECNDNLLTELDVSSLTNLAELYCYSNLINTVNLNNLTSLRVLSCARNNLAEIDVSGLTNLTSLSCSKNQLTTLDVSNLVNLKELNCNGNQLEDIYGLNNLTNLTSMDCGNNQLTSLEVNNLSNLKYLYCQHNLITSLDISNLPKMIELYCYVNQLTTLDIRNSQALQSLSCYQNNFTTQALDDIYCALPDTEGIILPAHSPYDDNIDTILATNAQNAIDKNWTVRYHVDNSDITTTGNYECTTDINSIELDNDVKIYPNPVDDLLYIDSESTINEIRIFDISGKEIFNKTINYLTNTSIDLSSLISGTYFLQIYTDKGVNKHSFIKK